MDDRTRTQAGVVGEGAVDGVDTRPFQVAVIGSGPGGMFTAWPLAAKVGPRREITVFEARDRLGAKVQTGQLGGVSPYEAGAAEIYDYSRLGPDSLLGFDPTGIERDHAAWLAAPRDIARLPFGDGEFEAVVETGLCRAAPIDAEKAIAEIHRVTKRGALLGSVTTDLPIDVIESTALEDVRFLRSRWDWSEKFHAARFARARFDPERLGEAWERTAASRAKPGQWREDPESPLLREGFAAMGGKHCQEEYDDVALFEA